MSFKNHVLTSSISQFLIGLWLTEDPKIRRANGRVRSSHLPFAFYLPLAFATCPFPFAIFPFPFVHCPFSTFQWPFYWSRAWPPWGHDPTKPDTGPSLVADFRAFGPFWRSFFDFFDHLERHRKFMVFLTAPKCPKSTSMAIGRLHGRFSTNFQSAAPRRGAWRVRPVTSQPDIA